MNRLVFGFSSVALACASIAATAGLQTEEKQTVQLTIYAAASLRDALQAIAFKYPKERGVELVFNFGTSNDLSKQIVATNKADVFFSDDEIEMDRLAANKQIEFGTRRSLLSSQLVVIEPAIPDDTEATNFAQPFSVEQLSNDKIKRLALANTETVSSGRYARAWLEKKNVWDRVAERVLTGIDDQAALAAVESGAAQAGIVYRPDAVRSRKVHVAFAVPTPEASRISFPVAVLARRPNVDRAKEFVGFLIAGRGVAKSFGFIVLEVAEESLAAASMPGQKVRSAVASFRNKESCFQDEYSHAYGDKVIVQRDDHDGALDVMVRSRDQTGVTVHLYISTGEDGSPEVRASARWRRDYGPNPHAGEVTDISGMVLCSSDSFLLASPLYLDFTLTGLKGKTQIGMTGALKVDR